MAKTAARRTRTDRQAKTGGRGPRLVVLPKPGRHWLLAGTALVTGVVGGLTYAPGLAQADCTETGNTVNCLDTFTTSGESFSADGTWQVNIQGDGNAAPGDEAHITGDDDAPVIEIDADGYNGVVQMDAETSITGSSGKGGDRDGIRILNGGELDLFIDGSIVAPDEGLSPGVALNFLDGTGSSQYDIDIGETGVLGAESDDLIINVDGAVQRTYINNWGEMNGRMTFDRDAQGVTFNNYSPNSWATSGFNLFTDGADIINNESASAETDGGFSIFELRGGQDTLINHKGATFETTSGITQFFFDNTDRYLLGLFPEPFTESGPQANDRLENTKGATFTTNNMTQFYFGGEDDVLSNTRGATFNTHDDTLFAFGSDDDMLENAKGATFNTSGSTDFYFDNPELAEIEIDLPFGVDIDIDLPIGVPYTEASNQGMDLLVNARGGTFNTGVAGGDIDVTSFYFGGNDDEMWNTERGRFNTFDITTFAFGTGHDTFGNDKGSVFQASGLTTYFFDNPDTVELGIDILGIDLTGITLPIPFTEGADFQGEDTFINAKGAIYYAGVDNGSLDVTSFFFGGNDDKFLNMEGGQFYASELTTFAFQSGEDKFINTKGGDFYASGVTTILLDNPFNFTGIEDGAFEQQIQNLDLELVGFFEDDVGYDDKFINTKGATFNTSGLTTIYTGGGSDEWWNTKGALFNAHDLTTVIMGGGLEDNAYNTSRIDVTGLLTFVGVENFYNSYYGEGGIIDMRNGSTVDVTSIFGGLDQPGGNFFGTAYAGDEWYSAVGVDAYLAGEGDPDGEADLLKIGGDIYGMTELVIDKTNPAPAGINYSGIDVVKYSFFDDAYVEYNCDGACREGDAFYISPFSQDYVEVDGIGAVQDGLFAWFLFQDDYGPGADFELRGLVGPAGTNTANIIQGAVNIALETGRFVEDHIYGYQFGGAGGGGADLPVDYSVADYSAPAASNGYRSGVWVKASGSWTEADSSVTQMGIDFDTSFDQNIYSIFGGADFKPGGDDNPWRIGILGGYLNSSLDFDLGGTSVDYEGGSVGAYVAYNNGAFYADGTVKGDFLDTTYDLGSGSDVSADTTNISVMANTGYRIMMGAGFIEPLLSLTYVHSETGSMTGGGGTVDFSNGESLQAGAGARVGTEFAMASGITEVSLLGKVWNEFEGDNTVTITDMAMNTESFTTDFGGVFGEVVANATFTSADEKWSTFLQGGGKFGEEFTTWNAQAGVRLGF